jgi:hypothetical protein
MYLNVKSAQDFSNKSVRRQAETGDEERLEHNQLAFRLGDFLRPRDTGDSTAKVTQPLHILHADRQHPRHTKPTVSPARNSSAAKVLSIFSEDASAGSVAAAEEEEVGIATHHRRRRAVCFTRARSPANKSKEGRRAGRRWKRRLGFSRSAEG